MERKNKILTKPTQAMTMYDRLLCKLANSRLELLNKVTDGKAVTREDINKGISITRELRYWDEITLQETHAGIIYTSRDINPSKSDSEYGGCGF